MRILIAAAGLLVLVACASQEPAPVANAAAAASAPAAASAVVAAASAPRMICHREEQTGSHMNRTVCEPEYQDNAAARDLVRTWTDQNARVNPSAVKTSGH